MKSLRAVSKVMEPLRPSLSLRELARLHRWDGGEIGTGPADPTAFLPAPILKLMGGGQNLHEALVRLDLIRHGRTSQPEVISLRDMAARHRPDDANRFRFLTYNTYLLKAEKLGITLSEKPLLELRARRIGEIVRQDYDIACLYEIFSDDVWSWFAEAWQGGPHHARNPADMDADVACVVQKGRIDKALFRTFNTKGRAFDSDALSDKGVLLTRIDTGFGILEVYSTHLFFGGGMDITPDALDFVTEPTEDILDWFGGVVGVDATPRSSNPEERSAVKLAQATELLTFYGKHHRPENVALIVGDFNIDANANLNRAGVMYGLARGASAEYRREYEALRALMGRYGFYDLWMWDAYARPPNSGYTARYTDGEIDKTFATCPTQTNDLCDDTRIYPPKRADIGEGRLDHIWIQKPETSHGYRLDTSRPVRRAFRHPTTGDGESEEYLSDHLGLAFDIIISPK